LEEVGDNTKEEQHEAILKTDRHTQEQDHGTRQEILQTVAQRGVGEECPVSVREYRDVLRGHRPGNRGHQMNERAPQ